MGRRGAAPAATPHLIMVLATYTLLAAATFMSTAEADCSKSMAQQVSSTSGRFRVAEGAEDGVYVGRVEVDEQGVEQYHVEFQGEGNTTLDGRWANNNVSPGGLGRKLLQDSGVHCDGTLLSPDDTNSAINGLANFFGRGRSIAGNQVAYYVYRCSVAYVCVYGDAELWANDSQVWVDNHQIDLTCLNVAGGWYARETAQCAFGRTFLGVSFC